MAITSSNVTLPQGAAEALITSARQQSIIMSLAPQVPLAYGGTTVPVFTGDPTAYVVAEGAAKTASDATVGTKLLTPRKVVVVQPVSNEVFRANPGNVISAVQQEMAGAIARKVDDIAFNGASISGQAFIGQTTKTAAIGTTTKTNGGVWGDFNAVLSLLVDDDRDLNAWALDAKVEPIVNGAVDNNGRPLFLDNSVVDSAMRGGSIMGRRAVMGKSLGTTTVAAYAGDFSRARWGVVTSGITYDFNTSAVIGSINAYEQNLTLVRAELEFGFVVGDVEDFATLTYPSGS